MSQEHPKREKGEKYAEYQIGQVFSRPQEVRTITADVLKELLLRAYVEGWESHEFFIES